MTGPGLVPFILRKPKLSWLAVSGIATLDDALLDQIRENIPRLSNLSINDCSGVKNVESVLHLAYELKGDFEDSSRRNLV